MLWHFVASDMACPIARIALDEFIFPNWVERWVKPKPAKPIRRRLFEAKNQVAGFAGVKEGVSIHASAGNWPRMANSP